MNFTVNLTRFELDTLLKKAIQAEFGFEAKYISYNVDITDERQLSSLKDVVGVSIKCEAEKKISKPTWRAGPGVD